MKHPASPHCRDHRHLQSNLAAAVLQAPCTSHLSQTLINRTETHDIRYQRINLCIIPFAVSKLYGTQKDVNNLVS